MLFKDRQDAGRQLATKLAHLANNQNVLVLALPRGGVVLGHEISQRLNVPLDLILVRKLGVPWQEELAFGAIAVGNTEVLNEGIINSLGISNETIEEVKKKEEQELNRRNHLYRKDRPLPLINDKIIVLVDDGIATGATMRAAIRLVKACHPKEIIVATPLASISVFEDMSAEKIKLIVLETPEPFYGIGRWYSHFPQLTDEEVISLLT